MKYAITPQITNADILLEKKEVLVFHYAAMAISNLEYLTSFFTTPSPPPPQILGISEKNRRVFYRKLGEIIYVVN